MKLCLFNSSFPTVQTVQLCKQICCNIIFVPKGSDVASQQEFTSCLKDTLSGLAKNADYLQVIQ